MAASSQEEVEETRGSGYSGRDNLSAMADAVNYNRFLIRKVLQYAPQEGVVVDFGAGTGLFAQELAKRALKTICVEVDHELNAVLRQAGLAVVPSLGEVADGSVDYIYSLNVLEHLADDREVLRQMNRCLRPGGTLFLYVPAFAILFSSMDRKIGHLRRYRMGQIRKLGREAGFEPIHAAYCDSLGFLASLVFRVVGGSVGTLNPRALRFYDRVIFPLSKALDHIVGRFVGKNVSVVFRKPH